MEIKNRAPIRGPIATINQFEVTIIFECVIHFSLQMRGCFFHICIKIPLESNSQQFPAHHNGRMKSIKTPLAHCEGWSRACSKAIAWLPSLPRVISVMDLFLNGPHGLGSWRFMDCHVCGRSFSRTRLRNPSFHHFRYAESNRSISFFCASSAVLCVAIKVFAIESFPGPGIWFSK
jgi:hypothetical protein